MSEIYISICAELTRTALTVRSAGLAGRGICARGGDGRRASRGKPFGHALPWSFGRAALNSVIASQPRATLCSHMIA